MNPVRWVEVTMKAFFFAFWAGAAVYLPGIWEAPNMKDAVGIGVVAFGAGLAAGLIGIKVLLPQFSFATLPGFNRLPVAWIARIDLFVATFVGTLIVAITDFINQSPDLTGWKLIIVPALTGAAAAAFRTLVATITPNEHPFPDRGVGKPVV